MVFHRHLTCKHWMQTEHEFTSEKKSCKEGALVHHTPIQQSGVVLSNEQCC